MSPSCASLFVLFVFVEYISCFTGDPIMYFPPLEVRAVKPDRPLTHVSGNPQFQINRGPVVPSQSQKPTLHTNAVHHHSQTPQPTRLDKDKLADARNITLTELLDAWNSLEEKKDDRRENSRAAEYDYPQYPPYGYRPPTYGYQRPPPYGYHSVDSYNEPPAAYVPPSTVHHSSSKLSLLKPELGDIIKPVSTKVASKVSGLIGLVLALLTGSAPNDLELKGFKDIIINGIVKPLLVAKGGIKSLISKLTIPVISLLLINLEVLITVWWLWEDCPENPPPPYNYPKPSYGYNSY